MQHETEPSSVHRPGNRGAERYHRDGGIPANDFCNPSPRKTLTAGTLHLTGCRYKTLTWILFVSTRGCGKESHCSLTRWRKRTQWREIRLWPYSYIVRFQFSDQIKSGQIKTTAPDFVIHLNISSCCHFSTPLLGCGVWGQRGSVCLCLNDGLNRNWAQLSLYQFPLLHLLTYPLVNLFSVAFAERRKWNSNDCPFVSTKTSIVFHKDGGGWRTQYLGSFPHCW